MVTIRTILPLIALALIMLSSCRDANNGGVSYGDIHISGIISGEKSLKLLFEELTPTEIIRLDTIHTDKDGFFYFEWYLDNAGFFRISNGQNDFITLAAEPGQNIYITAHSDNLRSTYTVEGSEGSLLLWSINQEHFRNLKHTDSLRHAYHEARYSHDYLQIRNTLTEEFHAVKDNFRDYLLETVSSNLTQLASILALHHYFEDDILLNEDAHFDHFTKLSKTLCKHYPGNKHVIHLKKRVKDHKRKQEMHQRNEENLAIGRVAPDITLPDPDGAPLSLSSLKGSVVLIDFWAAWCPPCREANIILAELYAEYHQKGFDIYGISLDRNRQQWLRAIEQDNITWKQVSDLRFMNSPVVSLYNVTEVPHYVLLNRDGEIISRNFSIHELEGLLRENL